MTRTLHPGPALLALVGPTASGKTEVALALAERFGAHIVNYDSVQLYEGLEIGAAKPAPEERARYPHHLYDLGTPSFEPTAGAYAKAAGELLDSLLLEERRVVLVGGTGLYLRALCHGLSGAPPTSEETRATLEARFEGRPLEELHGELARVDPVAAARIGQRDRQRILRALGVYEQTGRPLSDWQEAHGFKESRFEPVLLGLASDRDALYKRIDERSARMLENGLLDEVERLLEMGYRPGGRALSSIGYRHALEYRAGNWSREETLELLARDTRRYAKRQLAWWRPDERVQWMNTSEGPGPFVDAAAKYWREP